MNERDQRLSDMIDDLLEGFKRVDRAFSGAFILRPTAPAGMRDLEWKFNNIEGEEIEGFPGAIRYVPQDPVHRRDLGYSFSQMRLQAYDERGRVRVLENQEDNTYTIVDTQDPTLGIIKVFPGQTDTGEPEIVCVEYYPQWGGELETS